MHVCLGSEKASQVASLDGGLALQSVHTAADGTRKMVFSLTVSTWVCCRPPPHFLLMLTLYISRGRCLGPRHMPACVCPVSLFVINSSCLCR